MTAFSMRAARARWLLLVLATGAARADHEIATVNVDGTRPTSLPLFIPATSETLTAAEMRERINAVDAADALKYFPSLNVRKRFIGDFDHAVLASRASGTGNSARSLVYADGILLSNLLGNGAQYTPRWGLVTPSEIERVDVLYGPFSAAYPGNSAGAVVDYQTRMPRRLSGHVQLLGAYQAADVYRSSGRYGAGQGSAALGNRHGAWAWQMDVSRLSSRSHPMSYPNRVVSTGAVSNAGLPVEGAQADRNPAGRDWWILGASGQADTMQDHAKFKLSHDISPVLRASYLFGWWRNDSLRTATSYLRDASGAPVLRGAPCDVPAAQRDACGSINIGGRRFELRPADFAPSRNQSGHAMHGLTLKRHARDSFNWELAVSRYRYIKDRVRTPTVLVAGPDEAVRGTVTDQEGSGWRTLSLRASWKPGAGHTLEAGVQQELAELRTRVGTATDWRVGCGCVPLAVFNGNTRLDSLFVQDLWRFAPGWTAVLGLRGERWRAYGGEIGDAAHAARPLRFGARNALAWSPKAAVSFVAGQGWTLKAAAGRAVRNPTAAEMFQGTVLNGAIVNRDPNLGAERSWTGELSAERVLEQGSLRVTAFGERTREALYAQPLNATVTTIQNVERIETAGLELAL